MATTYLYSISPKKPIRFLCGVAVVPPIRTPKSVQLTLEQVKDSLKYGSVYRRFTEEKRNERVTTANVERLHNAHYLTEEEFNALSSNVVKDDKEIVEEKKVEEIHIQQKSVSTEEENRRGQAIITDPVEPTIEVGADEAQDNSEDSLDKELVEETEVDDSINDEIVEAEEAIEESIDEDVEDEVLNESCCEEDSEFVKEKSNDNAKNYESYSNKNNSYNKNHKKNKH